MKTLLCSLFSSVICHFLCLLANLLFLIFYLSIFLVLVAFSCLSSLLYWLHCLYLFSSFETDVSVCYFIYFASLFFIFWVTFKKVEFRLFEYFNAGACFSFLLLTDRQLNVKSLAVETSQKGKKDKNSK